MAYDTQRVGREVEVEKPVMERILDRMNDLHGFAVQLDEITTRMCGGNRDQGGKALGPAVVPDGLVDQISDGMRGLQDRLDSILTRLRLVA